MRTAPLPVTDEPVADGFAGFTSLLRNDPRAANPPDWTVDWGRGPWPVKVYDGGVRTPVPPGPLDRLFSDGFAISRVRFDQKDPVPATPRTPARRHGHGLPIVQRRPIPSGGAMYPTEVYLVHADAVYHYDPYRHELTDLGDRGAAGELRAAVGGVSPHRTLLVLANRFDKNFHKYGDFAFRLGAVDVGVALGRAVRLASVHFGDCAVRLGFDDERANGALGLTDGAENVSAVVAFTGEFGATLPADGSGIPAGVVERAEPVPRSDRFDRAQRAVRADGGAEAESLPQPQAVGDPVGLPGACPADVASALRGRTSNGHLFDGSPATPEQVAAVLTEGAAASRRLAEHGVTEQVELYCAVHNVRDVPAGWYRAEAGRLIPVGVGADRGCGARVQAALYAATVNVELGAFTVHPVAATDSGGPRDYRRRQLAVGAAVEALTLGAAACGLGGHPLLGFDVSTVDAGYGLRGGGLGVQAQVCFGRVRPGPAWEVPVRTRRST